MHPRVTTMPLDNALEVSTAKRLPNKHYHTDIMQTVQYPRLFLGLLGVWPMLSRDSSPAKKYIFSLLIAGFLILLTFIIVPPTLHIILREEDTRLRLITFAPVSYHLVNLIKFGFFLIRFKTMKLCVEHVETDWMSIESEGDRAIMKSNTRVGRSLTVISCAFSWTCGISYHTIVPILQGKTINEINETVRSLAYPGYDMFFDSQSQPTYEIIFIAICASAFISYTVTSASCSFTAGFVSHACGLLEIVISRLEILVDSIEIHKNENQLENRQSFITQCHIRILRLSSGIEEVLREICFMEVVCSTMTICSVEYYLVTERSSNDPARILTYFVGMFTCSLNIWLFCYIGELLEEQCTISTDMTFSTVYQGRRVGETAYMIEWYKLPYKSCHDLIMIIIMSNNCPPKITAGRVFELSIRSFGSILKMTVTYCNMLRALTA